MNAPRAAARQAGLSSAEVIVMAAIMSVLMIMITESMTTLTGVRSEQRAQIRLGDVTDKVARRIEQDLGYATRIFTDTPADLEYLQAMDVGVDFAGPDRRLPKLTTRGFFEPDKAGAPETGNVLFLARRLPRAQLDTERLTGTMVQGYVFTVATPIDVGGQLDLLRWNSEPVADYWDLAGIADLAARAEVLVQLLEHGVHFAWDPSAPRSSGLFEISDAGALVQLDADRPIPGTEERASSRPFRPRHLAIAPNTTDPPHRVPAYARQNGAFPGGFELKIDGAAAGKLVLLRIVTQSTLEARQVSGELLRFLTTNG